nr:hypothetical protein [Tanacetum cinerariifolium]
MLLKRIQGIPSDSDVRRRRREDSLLHRPRNLLLHKNVVRIKEHRGDKGESQKDESGRRHAIYQNLEGDAKSKWEASSFEPFPVQIHREGPTIFETSKNITKENKDDYMWTEEAELAFQELKKLIIELPMLTIPKPKEILYVYLAASCDAVSGVLVADRKGKQTPIGYFEAHRIRVITDQPINQILNKPKVSKKLAKYAVELGEYNITHVPRNAIKGQVLADFINEIPTGTKHLEICSLTSEENTEEWILYTDGASCLKEVGARLVLIDPSDTEYTYAIYLTIASTNNEVEYEALLVGLQIAHKMKVQALKVKVDSKLVSC